MEPEEIHALVRGDRVMSIDMVDVIFIGVFLFVLAFAVSLNS